MFSDILGRAGSTHVVHGRTCMAIGGFGSIAYGLLKGVGGGELWLVYVGPYMITDALG